MSQKVLLTAKEVTIILHRLACQLVEKHLDFSDTILVGIQPRGVFLAERLKEILESEYQTPEITLGYLDITFFRDDFRRTEKPLEANKTNINFIVENKIPAVFIEHAVNAKNIESLVEACSFNNWQVKIGKPLYSDSFGKINTPQGNYIGMQKYNALVIYEALK